MPRQAHLIRIFLASPGDVAEERKVARRVIEETNRIAASRGLVLQVVGWETDTIPQLGGDAQSMVNSQIFDPADYDLFVGIMWNRFGSPTPRANSGTEEEFRLVVTSMTESRQPHIMFYFCGRPTIFEGVDALDQMRAVMLFRQEVQSMGLTSSYQSVEDFERLFREHLHRWLENVGIDQKSARTLTRGKPRVAPATQSVPREGQAPTRHWMLLKDRIFQFDSIDDPGDGKIVVRLPAPPPEDEALLRSFQNSGHWGREPLPYAADLDGGIVTVEKAERSTKAGVSLWTLTLSLDRQHQRSSFNFTVNGMTMKQMAEKRARLILLNEKLPDDSDGMLALAIGGARGAIKVRKGIFPELWTQFHGEAALFPELARLWAIFHLKASQTVEHVFQLTVSPVSHGAMHISFRGQRQSDYVDGPLDSVEVVGECRLE